MLPTSSGTPLRARLAVAWASRSWLSAAKPTQKRSPCRGCDDFATMARMSVFSTKPRVGVWPEPSFLIFWEDWLAGRQSATAAVATNTDAACTWRCTTASISWADCTFTRCTPRGVGTCTGPRSEEHTSELQSQSNLVCRLLL